MPKRIITKIACKRCGGYERYTVNRTCVLCSGKQSKSWRANNRPRVLELREDNKNRKLEYDRVWRVENRESGKRSSRRWRENNSEMHGSYNRAYASRKRAMLRGCSYESYLREDILERYPKCLSCYSVDRLELDHVVPISRGGPDCESNLQVLCKSCNISKFTKYHEYRPSYLLGEGD